MTNKVRGGTPHHGGPGLCHSCKNSLVFRGAAESEVTVLCNALEKQFVVRVPVVECSSYANKLEKSEWEMKQIAWVLSTRNGKPIGFVSPREAQKKSRDGEIDPVDDL